jgi:hypothetical protein
MSLETAVGAQAPAAFPIQFVNIEITPLQGGEYSVVMQATLLDEQELEFVAEDLVSERVDTLDQALAVIRRNVAALAPGA